MSFADTEKRWRELAVELEDSNPSLSQDLGSWAFAISPDGNAVDTRDALVDAVAQLLEGELA